MGTHQRLKRNEVFIGRGIGERIIQGLDNTSVIVQPQISTVTETTIKPHLYGQHIANNGVRRFERIAEGTSVVRGHTTLVLWVDNRRLEATLFWVALGGQAPFAALYEFCSPQIDRARHKEPVVLDMDMQLIITDGARKLSVKDSREWLYAIVNANLDWKRHVREVLPVMPRAETFDLRDCCVVADLVTPKESELGLPNQPHTACQDRASCSLWRNVTLEHDDAPVLSFTGRRLACVDDLEEQIDAQLATRFTRYQLYETPSEQFIAVVQACNTHPSQREITHSRVCYTFADVVDWLGDHHLSHALVKQALTHPDDEAQIA